MRQKLVFRFHNPNTEQETTQYISKIFLEASRVKWEERLAEYCHKQSEGEISTESVRCY